MSKPKPTTTTYVGRTPASFTTHAAAKAAKKAGVKVEGSKSKVKRKPISKKGR